MKRKNSTTQKAAGTRQIRVDRADSAPGRGAAFLWDESFLWGVMAYKALQAAGLCFDLIRADEIRKGGLGKYAMLYVPGGWSTHKIKALGEKGVDAVRDFVHRGGSYLGFCGGAGLATLDGIGLLDIRRRPTRERVPSFSGKIRLELMPHTIWDGIHEPVFHAWWPPQFSVPEAGISILASYREALPDSFSSDLNTGDMASGGRWEELERTYRINLDPNRLLGDPAVIEGTFGSGRVILSLVHFDTPDDAAGARVLQNIWGLLAPGGPPADPVARTILAPAGEQAGTPSLAAICEAEITRLIDLGIRNFLWFWRNPMLLQWRRGVRGLEYCTLFVMIREIAQRLRQLPQGSDPQTRHQLKTISRRLIPFTEKAGDLLIRERLAMQGRQITYEDAGDPEIQMIREELFSLSKSHGGLFKALVGEIDSLLYRLYTMNISSFS